MSRKLKNRRPRRDTGLLHHTPHHHNSSKLTLFRINFTLPVQVQVCTINNRSTNTDF
jgi:hypothetical protein